MTDEQEWLEDEEEVIEDVVDDMAMRVLERVFVGSVDAAWNMDELRAKRIGAVLAVLDAGSPFFEQCAPSTRLTTAGITRWRIELADSAEAALLERLPSILTTLDAILTEAARQDVNVLVHCEAGRSRSPVIVAAWLMARRGFSCEQALAHLSLVRPWIALNDGFLRDLKAFEHKVHDDGC